MGDRKVGRALGPHNCLAYGSQICKSGSDYSSITFQNDANLAWIFQYSSLMSNVTTVARVEMTLKGHSRSSLMSPFSVYDLPIIFMETKSSSCIVSYTHD